MVDISKAGTRVDTGVSTVWLRDDGVLVELAHEGAHVTRASARRQIAAYGEVYGGIPRPLLVDIRGSRSVTREARVTLSGPDVQQHVTAVALLIGSPISRVIGNFFVGFNRGAFPTRLFTSETEADAWLHGFLEKDT